jgi:hypothetical protein
MKFRRFLSVVPKPARTGAPILVACAALIGLIVGFPPGKPDGLSAFGASLHIPGSIAGLGFGLLVGTFMAVWVICLGYVYGDARRRVMPPVLWTLVAIFIPNLLGFLLYFAMRRPIALPCTYCGQAITANQRFCSWCGYQGPAASAGQTPPPPASSGLNPTAAI